MDPAGGDTMAKRLRAASIVGVLALASGCDQSSSAGDPDAGPSPDAVVAAREESAAECRDGLDNDGDGAIDCDDEACSAFIFCAMIDAEVPADAGVDAGLDAGRDAGGVTDAGGAMDGGVDAAAFDAATFDATTFDGAAFDAGGTDAPPDAYFDLPDVGPLALPDSGASRDGGIANPRPLDTPDFVIVAVSGHCNPTTCGTYPNIEYLARDGTIRAIAQPLLDTGARVDGYYLTDNFYDVPVGSALPGTPAAFGFLSLLNVLRYTRDELVSDWDNPTRVIVVAHSHGTVWAHLGLHVLEGEGAPLPVDLVIDFDAVSDGWQTKGFIGFGDAWGAVMTEYTTRTGTVWPFAVWNVVDAFAIPGVVPPQDIEDIVPNFALFNLEVWAASGPFPTISPDREINHRLSGTLDGVLLFRSVESHNGTVRVGSDSVTNATGIVREIYGL